MILQAATLGAAYKEAQRLARALAPCRLAISYAGDHEIVFWPKTRAVSFMPTGVRDTLSLTPNRDSAA